jgi:hypothetical protein
MSNFITVLKAEIAELEAELRADPRHRKLARLRETLAEYEPPNASKQPSLLLTPSETIISGMMNGTKEAKIKAELTAIFKAKGPQHRTLLLEHLKQKGLMGHEKDPLASLAAYLSGWKDSFAFDGKGIWGLPDQFADDEAR